MTDSPSGQPPAGQSSTPAAAAPTDYATMLSQIPDDVLQSDRRLQSRIGNLGQRFAEQARQQIESEARQRESEAAEARMHRLAEEDPFQFSAQYLKQHAETQAHRQIEGLRRSEQETLMHAVGAAYGQLPEWPEIMADPANAQRLAQAVAGRTSPADMVASFNATALDIVAERRAQHLPGNKDRLDAEVEARVQERLAARLRGETVPEMTAARTISGSLDVRGMTDEQFNRFYKSTFGV